MCVCRVCVGVYLLLLLLQSVCLSTAATAAFNVCVPCVCRVCAVCVPCVCRCILAIAAIVCVPTVLLLLPTSVCQLRAVVYLLLLKSCVNLLPLPSETWRVPAGFEKCVLGSQKWRKSTGTKSLSDSYTCVVVST